MLVDPARIGTPSPYGEVPVLIPNQGNLPLMDEELQNGLPKVVTLDELPIEDISGIVPIEADQTALVCKLRRTSSRALSAMARVMSPLETSYANSSGVNAGGTTDETNPFNITLVPATSTLVLPANIKQQIEIIGFLTVGNSDLMIDIPFNMAYNRIVRLSQFGSVLIVKARATSRYYPSITVGGVVSWLVGADGSNFDRNEMFNNPPPASRNATGPRSLMVQGFAGEGFTAPVPPMRSFFGWVEPLAAQNTQHLCPIPRGAESVFLMSDFSAANNDPAAGAAFQGELLQLNFVHLSPGGGVTRRVLNAPVGSTVPIASDAVAVEVTNVSVPAAGIGVPFELMYDVGF